MQNSSSQQKLSCKYQAAQRAKSNISRSPVIQRPAKRCLQHLKPQHWRFKRKVDSFLQKVADKPLVRGYTSGRLTESNSLTHMIPHHTRSGSLSDTPPTTRRSLELRWHWCCLKPRKSKEKKVLFAETLICEICLKKRVMREYFKHNLYIYTISKQIVVPH